jgi:crescentin
MASRSEAAEKLLAEARTNLREREADIRGFEQRAVESALAAKAKDAALADVEKDLAAARASHAEVDAVRATLDQRSAELAKALEAKGAALQRAEQKIVMVESRVAEQTKAMETERDELEASVAKLKEQFDAEQSARSFAEGALQAARQERGSRRHEAEGAGPPKEPPTPVNESPRDKITRLRG